MFRYFIAPLVAFVAFSIAGEVSAASLELSDCRISAGPGAPSMKARCGTMLRPLDPSGVEPGEIELRVAVVPALNLTPELDPLVPIAGGPGQGSVQFYIELFIRIIGVHNRNFYHRASHPF